MNWTATYRLDSTLVAPYERFTYFANYSGQLPDRPARDVKAQKSRHVAWFASNCGAPNGRQSYVEELQKYIGQCVPAWYLPVFAGRWGGGRVRVSPPH